MFLQAIKEQVTSDKEFKLTGERSVTLEQYPGVELTFESGQERQIIRIYLVKNRAYGLGVRHPKSTTDMRVPRTFLNALELLEDS